MENKDITEAFSALEEAVTLFFNSVTEQTTEPCTDPARNELAEEDVK